MIYRWTIALAFVIPVEGCTSLREGLIREYTLRMPGARGQVVNVAYTRTTGWHIMGDRDQSPLGGIRVEALQLLRAGDKLLEAKSTGGGVPAPIPIAKQVYPGNLLVLEGWNPIIVTDSDPMYDVIQREDRRFAAKYSYDPLVQERRRHDVRFSQGKVPWTVTVKFHCLPRTRADIRAGLQVDHGLLVYLLQDKAFWSQLKDRWNRGMDKEEVRGICRAVLAMISAHELEWPQYKWKVGNQRVRTWCVEVSRTK